MGPPCRKDVCLLCSQAVHMLRVCQLVAAYGIFTMVQISAITTTGAVRISSWKRSIPWTGVRVTTCCRYRAQGGLRRYSRSFRRHTDRRA